MRKINRIVILPGEAQMVVGYTILIDGKDSSGNPVQTVDPANSNLTTNLSLSSGVSTKTFIADVQSLLDAQLDAVSLHEAAANLLVMRAENDALRASNKTLEAKVSAMTATAASADQGSTKK